MVLSPCQVHHQCFLDQLPPVRWLLKSEDFAPYIECLSVGLSCSLDSSTARRPSIYPPESCTIFLMPVSEPSNSSSRHCPCPVCVSIGPPDPGFVVVLDESDTRTPRVFVLQSLVCAHPRSDQVVMQRKSCCNLQRADVSFPNQQECLPACCECGAVRVEATRRLHPHDSGFRNRKLKSRLCECCFGRR